ncbi:MAG TPA: SH3 domain-containing protein [Thermoanaerobaculia bacterium]|nr:SH3 domain-containing protein [Thermoanaerobaculia bacterium]
MKRVFVPLLLLAAFCKPAQPPVTETMDTRAPIGIRFVGAPELPVREQPNETAPVIATYQNGEAVSVLAERGEWAEVRTGSRSGWVRMSDLTNAEAIAQQDKAPEPKFRIMPLPVSAPSAQGEIYIEADVNTDGDVVNTRLITNTTGSAALAAQNESALRAAKFHPIVIKNERQPFKYYHRVTY